MRAIRRWRWTLLLVVLASVVTACEGLDAADDNPRAEGSPTAPPDDGGTTGGDTGGGDDGGGDGGGGTTGGDGDGTTTGGDGGGTGGGTGGDDTTDGDTTGGGAPPAETDDFGGVGANGRAMLRASVPRLIVEIDFQEGAEPVQSAVDHLVNTLRDVADKPDGITFAGGNSFSSERREWTRDDLRAAAEQNRANFSSGDTVVLYLLYVRGSFFAEGEETSAIGVSYNGSEAGIFPDKWRDVVGGVVGSTSAVERAVLVHELGHLFGLVNLTYQSDIDHEDPQHPGHSDNRDSVMFWAIEDIDALNQLFSGPPPDTFDRADRADLDGLRTGRY